MTNQTSATIPDLADGPYDIEFFFDPGCPFAWQTSVWIRRVSELNGIKIGWRFISLKFINEGEDVAPGYVTTHDRGLRYHRICAAARAEFGNDAVGALYQAWGERFWYTDRSGSAAERFGEASVQVDPAEILESLDLPARLLDAAEDEAWDQQIRAESDEAFRRTGDGVGTPIITYDPPNGNSLFGPVISAVPDDETSLAFYDALRTFADFRGFSELKRTDRQPLDLPLLHRD